MIIDIKTKYTVIIMKAMAIIRLCITGAVLCCSGCASYQAGLVRQVLATGGSSGPGRRKSAGNGV